MTYHNAFGCLVSGLLVDWLVVELRDPSDETVRVASRGALIQRDGDVVSADGVSPVVFNALAGNYHLAIRLRNHLGVMTATPVALSGTSTLIAVGSTTPNNTVANVYDRRDSNLDGVIKYAGSSNDHDVILTNVGSTTPNNTRTQQLP